MTTMQNLPSAMRPIMPGVSKSRLRWRKPGAAASWQRKLARPATRLENREERRQELSVRARCSVRKLPRVDRWRGLFVSRRLHPQDKGGAYSSNRNGQSLLSQSGRENHGFIPRNVPRAPAAYTAEPSAPTEHLPHQPTSASVHYPDKWTLSSCDRRRTERRLSPDAYPPSTVPQVAPEHRAAHLRDSMHGPSCTRASPS